MKDRYEVVQFDEKNFGVRDNHDTPLWDMPYYVEPARQKRILFKDGKITGAAAMWSVPEIVAENCFMSKKDACTLRDILVEKERAEQAKRAKIRLATVVSC